MKAFSQQLSDMTGNFYAAERARRFVPCADPVDGSGHRKRRELSVAWRDGSVGDSFFDVAADGRIDAALERSHFFARLRGEFVLVQHGNTAAEVVQHDRFRISFDIGFDLRETSAATDKGLVQQSFYQRDAGAVALDKDLFFVVEVVVEGGLCDLQPLCQLAHRGT